MVWIARVFNGQPGRGGATGDPTAWASPEPSGRRWQRQGWGHGCAAAADSGGAAAASGGVALPPGLTAVAGASHRSEAAPSLA
jgi:hypothetical protein